MSKSLLEWLDYIYALHPREIDLGLDRIATLANTLGLTQFSCPVITIGGTNGKGSVVRSLENIYLQAGYHVAAYTSPHILKFNERLRINGELVSDEDLLIAFAFIESHRGNQPLSFFEFTTLSILYICQQISLDVLLLEVGLGGRLDAVNIVDAEIAVISNVDLYHMEWLGTEREAIGREKAGIMRHAKPVVCGDADPPQSVLQYATDCHAPCYCFKRDFNYRVLNNAWEWHGPMTQYLRLPFPQLKLQNVATSLMAIELLQTRLPVTPYAVMTGVKNLSLSGRFEQIYEPANIIYDVAHNPQATRYLAQQLQRLPHRGKTLAVFGMLRDKDVKNSVRTLIPWIDDWYVGSLIVPRGASADEILAVLTAQGVKSCYNFASIEEALKEAIQHCGSEDRIIIFGSFYTVAIAKQYLLNSVSCI